MILNIQQNAESLKIPPDIYVRILGKAVTQTVADIREMETALPVADFDKLQSISHRWKGDYDNMRITTLSTIAREMNLEIKGSRDKEKLAVLLAQFKDVFTQLQNELGILNKK